MSVKRSLRLPSSRRRRRPAHTRRLLQARRRLPHGAAPPQCTGKKNQRRGACKGPARGGERCGRSAACLRQRRDREKGGPGYGSVWSVRCGSWNIKSGRAETGWCVLSAQSKRKAKRRASVVDWIGWWEGDRWCEKPRGGCSVRARAAGEHAVQSIGPRRAAQRAMRWEDRTSQGGMGRVKRVRCWGCMRPVQCSEDADADRY